MLIAASFFFYGWWDWRFLFLLLLSGCFDYFSGMAMERYPEKKRLFLIFSISVNIGILAIFKYSLFIAQNIDFFFNAIGRGGRMAGNVPVLFTLTPIGLSFYTFQSLSYTIDVYRGKLRPTHSILHFFAYLSLFPQLVAGPIVRARELLPQLAADVESTEYSRMQGLTRIIFGFFKKMVIADGVGLFVNTAFSNPDYYTGSFLWWFVGIGFAIQIYCDFSGYSDIAFGLGRFMGYSFPANFDLPYVSTSIREFWNRWHISLSTWFRDYVYIPLGGNKDSKAKSHVRLWLTMLTGGLWHGASWTFIAWGALNAGYVSIERMTKRKERAFFDTIFGKIIAWSVCMMQIIIAWIIFRSASLREAASIIKKMFIWNGPFLQDDFVFIFVYFVLFIITETVFTLWRTRWMEPVMKGPSRFLKPVLLGIIGAAAIIFRGPQNQFIYFQF